MHRPLARAAQRPRGAVVLAFVVLLAVLLPMALLATGALTRPEESVRQRSLTALQYAREVLIARAIKGRRDEFNTPPAYRPGALPCPDVDDDGDADGSHCFNYVGRLPYKTLEIDDLRDGSGERLWYVLSPAFRPALHPTHESPAQLRLLDDPRLYAALLIAAGPVVAVQSRGCDLAAGPSPCARMQVGGFLEGHNAHTIHSPVPPDAQLIFETRAGSGRTEPGFNDLVLGITPAMFMPQVQRRLAREGLHCMRKLDMSGATAWQPFPPATDWELGEALCRGSAPYEYFEVWRPLLRMQHVERLRVSAGDVVQCDGMGGASC